MGLAALMSGCCKERSSTETQKPNLDLVVQEQLSQEELDHFKYVIYRYAHGDDHERMNLWLDHRDLRKTFEVLDQIG